MLARSVQTEGALFIGIGCVVCSAPAVRVHPRFMQGSCAVLVSPLTPPQPRSRGLLCNPVLCKGEGRGAIPLLESVLEREPSSGPFQLSAYGFIAPTRRYASIDVYDASNDDHCMGMEGLQHKTYLLLWTCCRFLPPSAAERASRESCFAGPIVCGGDRRARQLRPMGGGDRPSITLK